MMGFVSNLTKAPGRTGGFGLVIRISLWLEPLPGPRKPGTRGTRLPLMRSYAL